MLICFIAHGLFLWQWQSYIVATETTRPTKSCLSLYRKKKKKKVCQHLTSTMNESIPYGKPRSTENGQHPARNAINSNFSRLREAKKNRTSASRDSWWNHKLWRHWALLQLAMVMQRHMISRMTKSVHVLGKLRKLQWLNATDNCNNLRISQRGLSINVWRGVQGLHV